MKLYLPALTYGGIEGGHMHAMRILTHHLRTRGVDHVIPEPITGESLITRGRNRVAHAFMASDCTHMLLVDCDIVFTPADVDRLIDSGLPFVGAPYPAKAFPPALIGVPLAEPTADGQAAQVFVRKDGFVRAQDVATGFLLLAREVFERIAPRVVRYKDDLIGGAGETIAAYFDCGPEDSSRDDSQYLSEDWWFSRLYRACGGECWLDTRARLGHIGKHCFRAPTFEEQWAKEAAE